MENYRKEFIMSMFMDYDGVSSINRLAVAAATIAHDNHKNLCKFNEVMRREYNQVTQVIAEDNPADILTTSRLKDFFERTVQNFTEEQYTEKFKMKRSTTLALIDTLKAYIKPGNVPLDKKVHVFLWFLINDCSYNEVGMLFDLHKSSVSYIFHEIAEQLTELRHEYISWPSIEEQHITRIKIYNKYKFPNCVGLIDASRLKVGSKRNKRHKPHNILLQAVCDESLLFLDIHVGEIGKTKKSKAFRESQLSCELKNFVEFENHILGNTEYKLRKNLITPFSSEELLTPEEMKFNEIHWRTRSYIGHAFEILKERFRKLNHIDVIKSESVNILITAACVLHNFILMHEGCSTVKEELITCDDAITINPSIVKTAEEKRQFLCEFVNYMDADLSL